MEKVENLFNQKKEDKKNKDEITSNKKILTSAERVQLREMKRAGVEQVEDLPGESK